MDIFAIYGAWRCSRKSMVGSYGRKRAWVFWISITISHINKLVCACCFRLLFEKSFHMCDEKCNSDCLYWNKKDHIVVGCLNSLEHHLVTLNIPFRKYSVAKGRTKWSAWSCCLCAIQFKKNVTTTLPRSEDESLLKAKLKRKLKYKVK